VKLTIHLHIVPRLKNAWSYTSTPQYVFMVWCLVKHRDNFTFTIIIIIIIIISSFLSFQTFLRKKCLNVLLKRDFLDHQLRGRNTKEEIDEFMMGGPTLRKGPIKYLQSG
jgi:hypothetical protein